MKPISGVVMKFSKSSFGLSEFTGPAVAQIIARRNYAQKSKYFERIMSIL